MDDAAPDESPPEPVSEKPWFGRRKHIESRDVTGVQSDIEREMHAAAGGALKPTDVIDIPSLQSVPPPESIIDPTLFSVRQRRTSQNVAYRLTQGLILAALILPCAGIVNSLLGHRLRALASAGLGLMLAGIGVAIVRRSRLAYRLRGYVAAAGVLSVIALAVSLLPPMFRTEPPAAPPDKKAATTEPTGSI